MTGPCERTVHTEVVEDLLTDTGDPGLVCTVSILDHIGLEMCGGNGGLENWCFLGIGDTTLDRP